MSRLTIWKLQCDRNLNHKVNFCESIITVTGILLCFSSPPLVWSKMAPGTPYLSVPAPPTTPATTPAPPASTSMARP